MSPTGRVWALLRRVATSPATLYLVAAALSRLGTMVLIPLYTRRLSLAAYGDLALAQTIVPALPMILSWGLSAAIPMSYFGEKDHELGKRKAGNVAAWIAMSALVFGALVAAALWTFAPTTRDDLFRPERLSYVLIAGVGCTAYGVPAVYLRAAQKPIAAAAFQLSEFAITASCGFFFVGVLNRGLVGALQAMALSYGILGGVALLFIFAYLRGRPTPGALREALPIGLPFLPHFLATWTQALSDRWMLKIAGLDSELGSYALASQLASPAPLVVASFNDAESARLGEAFRSGGVSGLGAILKRTLRRYLLASTAPGVLITCALPLVPLFLGKTFASSLWITPLLLVVTAIDSTYYPSSNLVYFAGRTRFIPVVTAVSTGIGAIMYFVFIPMFGLPGAILAKASGSVLRGAAMWLLARRVVADAAAIRSAQGPAEASIGD